MKKSEVLYAVAHIGPATFHDVEAFYDHEKAGASRALTDAWRDGFLIRRKKEDRINQPGGTPYEYALRPVEEA